MKMESTSCCIRKSHGTEFHYMRNFTQQGRPKPLVLKRASSALMELIQARADIGPNNSKLFQAELERRAIHSEAHRRPAYTTENPPGLFEDCQNVRAFGCFQSLVLAIISAKCDAVIKILERNLQHGSMRNNHRALDYIL